jgi:dTDP-4-amino-4,6-dideoxygalactose transaminase
MPNHQQRPYRDMESYRITNAVRLYDRVVNLPCSVTLTPEQIDEVLEVIDQSATGSQA